MKNSAQLALIHHLAEMDLDTRMEYLFASPRKWRFDIAIPDWRVAIEIEGGAWVQGRHTRGKGFIGDIEKYAEAFARGWTVLRVTPDMAADGRAKEYVRRWLEPCSGRLLARDAEPASLPVVTPKQIVNDRQGIRQ